MRGVKRPTLRSIGGGTRGKYPWKIRRMGGRARIGIPRIRRVMRVRKLRW